MIHRKDRRNSGQTERRLTGSPISGRAGQPTIQDELPNPVRRHPLGPGAEERHHHRGADEGEPAGQEPSGVQLMCTSFSWKFGINTYNTL